MKHAEAPTAKPVTAMAAAPVVVTEVEESSI
jgi:hypothetical protein